MSLAYFAVAEAAIASSVARDACNLKPPTKRRVVARRDPIERPDPR